MLHFLMWAKQPQYFQFSSTTTPKHILLLPSEKEVECQVSSLEMYDPDWPTRHYLFSAPSLFL